MSNKGHYQRLCKQCKQLQHEPLLYDRSHLVIRDMQVKDGDRIKIDAETRSIDAIDIDDAEWDRRRSEWKEPPLKYMSGVLYKYIKNVTSASIGCVTDL